MHPVAPEAPSLGARDSRSGVAVQGETQFAAPENKAPKASVGHREAEPNGSPQLGAPEAASSGASPVTPCTGRHAQCFGWLRVDFDALRKRKGSPSCSSGAFRPLKQMKYITIDE